MGSLPWNSLLRKTDMQTNLRCNMESKEDWTLEYELNVYLKLVRRACYFMEYYHELYCNVNIHPLLSFVNLEQHSVCLDSKL